MRASETVHAEPRVVTDSPTYRVNFWQRSDAAWSLDAYVVDDVDNVIELLQWADQHSEGRRYEVFAETDDEQVHDFHTPRTTGLVRLAGSNPNSGVVIDMGGFDERV